MSATSCLYEKFQHVKNLRGGDDDLGVDELLLEDRVGALLVGGGDQSVALVLEPLADAKLVLSCSEQSRDLEFMFD